MDVRGKLVEILKQAPFEGKVLDEWWWEEKIVRIVDHLIANGVTVQEWISVKDRLPEVDEQVLVCGANGISIDWLEDYGELGLRWGNLCCGSYKPKYWKPMPQPPKGE